MAELGRMTLEELVSRSLGTSTVMCCGGRSPTWRTR